MIQVNIHTSIANEENKWAFTSLGTSEVFSLETVTRLFERYPDEQDFKFNINSPGGEVAEGLAIYDYLRTSGKNIYMNIEGACHSMAVTLLLAAPYENRSANPNASAIIHKAYTEAAGNIEDLEAAADNLRALQNKILDIYADRTTTSREELEQVMNEQKRRSAQDLLKWGFISKINPYNTNHTKNKAMNILEKISNFIDGIKQEVKEAVNYVYYGDDGERLFETDREDDFIEVGMTARPFNGDSGDFDIGERIVVIRENKITEIREKRTERDEELNALREENASLRQQLEDATANAANVTQELNEARNLLIEAKKHITSNGTIGNRIGGVNTNKGDNEPVSSADRKAAIRERLKK